MLNERIYFKIKQRKRKQEEYLNQFNNELIAVDLYQDSNGAKIWLLESQKKERDITDYDEELCLELFKKLCLQNNGVKVTHPKEQFVRSSEVQYLSQEDEFFDSKEIIMKKLKNHDVWGNKAEQDEGLYAKDQSAADTQDQDTCSAYVGEFNYIPIIFQSNRMQIHNKKQRIYTKKTRQPCSKLVNTISKQSKGIQKTLFFR